MRLISGTIAAEEKGRVARVGKVIKLVIYFLTLSIHCTIIITLLMY
jgi:hypothetical protein